MKKGCIFTAALFVFNAVVFSQTVLFEDNFDSYTAGQYLAVQSDVWTTWSETSGGSDDGLVTIDYALSMPNSVIVKDYQTDLILPLGDKTEGQFDVCFNMYIETGCGGYYNYLHKFDGDSSDWAIEVLFYENGTGYVRNINWEEMATFSYTKDAWIECKLIVDLDEDIAELYIDGSFVHNWQWSFDGSKQLGAVDFYSAAASGSPRYYIDDVRYCDMTLGVEEIHSTSSAGQYILRNNYPNPFNPTTTISFTIQKAGDVSLEVYTMNGQKVSTLVDGHLLEGEHSVIWNGTDDGGQSVPSGFYFYRLSCGEFTSIKKMVFVK